MTKKYLLQTAEKQIKVLKDIKENLNKAYENLYEEESFTVIDALSEAMEDNDKLIADWQAVIDKLK